MRKEEEIVIWLKMRGSSDEENEKMSDEKYGSNNANKKIQNHSLFKNER